MATVEKVKSNAVVTANWEGSKLTLIVKDAGSIVFDMDTVSAPLIERAAMHGFEQRLRDRAAIARDTKSGASASPAEKFARIKELVDHYAAGGEWEMRGGGAGRKSEADWIIEALASVKSCDVAEMRDRVATMAEARGLTVDAYLKQVATSAAVSAKIAELKYGAAEGADELLDDLK